MSNENRQKNKKISCPSASQARIPRVPCLIFVKTYYKKIYGKYLKNLNYDFL